MKSLALFDFDGTLTIKDSFLEILKYHRGNSGFWAKMFLLSPILIAFKLGFFPNFKAKEKVFKSFFGGMNQADFQELCDSFANHQLPKIIREEAIKKLRFHQQEGHRVIVVSASAENWLSLWCMQHGVELLGTRLEVINEKITGQIDGKNCHGPEKVNRIRDFLDPSEYESIYAYGDSSGDKEMLEFATDPFYRKF